MIRLVLPYPVSANRYWRSYVPRGHSRAIVVVSDEAKAYKRVVADLCIEAGIKFPRRDSVFCSFRLVPANGICMDLDNCLKVAIDSLKGIAYLDDSQVRKIVAERAEPDGKARLEVEIHAYQPPQAALFQEADDAEARRAA